MLKKFIKKKFRDLKNFQVNLIQKACGQKSIRLNFLQNTISQKFNNFFF